MHELMTPVYTSSPPTLESTSEFYKPTSQPNRPSPTAGEPISKIYEPSPPPISKIYEPSPPPYKPTTETYVTSSPKYENTTQIHKAITATYVPISHTYKPSTPGHKPTQTEVSTKYTGKVISIKNIFRLHQE
jgi:hypothetical protein